MVGKYHLIFLVSIISLIFIAGCQQQDSVICNEPYILVGNECCLDQNNNSICDKDENNQINQSQIENDTAKLEDLAKKFGRLLEIDKFDELYDLLTPERQTYKSKEEFIKLYRLIFGEYRYSSVLLNKVEIEGEKLGLAYYDLVWGGGYQETSGGFYFEKINNGWYFDGFSHVVYAGCFETNDCYKNSDKLEMVCEESCKKEGNGLLWKSVGKEFSCDGNICNCICWNQDKTQGTHAIPDWKFVH